MIGLFGTLRPSADQPVETRPFLDRLPAGRPVETLDGTGVAVGVHAHRMGFDGHVWTSPNGRWRAVALGEAFNLADLWPGPVPSGAEGNLAALLATLAEAGTWRPLAEANGLFCGALYDKTRHALTLVTDRMAGFPLHVWRGAGSVHFAGQIHTLLGQPEIPRKADRRGLAQLFTMQRTVGATTSVAGVEALPAACVRTFRADGVDDHRYWTLTWTNSARSKAETAERLAAALRAAAGRMTAEGGAGLLLSGGLDSRMILAAAPRGQLSGWTTASFADNPELALARETAERLGAPFHPCVVAPGDTLGYLDQTTVENNALYPASTQFSCFVGAAGAGSSALLTGHGLDYTLRGYYLPSRFLTVAGSRTRLPMLRPVPARPTGADVLRNLRQGPPLETVERIVAAGQSDLWWRSQEDALQDVLGPWLNSAEPVNAWDAFILHALSKHYAFTGMMSVRAAAPLRLPAFDAEVFDVYLSMPPSWRVNGGVVFRALRLLSDEAADLPNANTGFRSDLGPYSEIAALLGRAVLRRTGLARRPAKPGTAHSEGSWQNIGALYRDDPGHRQLFQDIRGRLDSQTFGILDADGLAACIDEHLDGRGYHAKLLRHLMTHDAWMRTYGIDGHD